MTSNRHTPTHRRSLANFQGVGYDKGRGVAAQAAWVIVDALAFRRVWMPSRARTYILRAFGAKVGGGVLIRHGVKIHWPWKLTIGDHSWIGDGAWILNLEPVTIGGDTCVSQGVLLCTGSHDANSPTFEFDNAPITVGSGVWLGARATVLRGVNIGDDSTIGATCLVVSDVPEGSLLLAPLPLRASQRMA